jgi:hypothetical protein
MLALRHIRFNDFLGRIPAVMTRFLVASSPMETKPDVTRGALDYTTDSLLLFPPRLMMPNKSFVACSVLTYVANAAMN